MKGAWSGDVNHQFCGSPVISLEWLNLELSNFVHVEWSSADHLGSAIWSIEYRQYGTGNCELRSRSFTYCKSFQM